MNRAYLFYAGITLALVGLWFFGAFVPFQKEYEQARVEIDQAETQLADFQKTISELPVYIAKHQNLLNQRDDLNSKLYTKKDVLELFDALKFEAFRKNVSVTEITPPIEELLYLNTIIPDSSQPQFLNIGLKMEGDFVGFGKFIEEIEHAEYFRGINECKVYGHSDDKTKITMHLGFKALLGSLREEA